MISLDTEKIRKASDNFKALFRVCIVSYNIPKTEMCIDIIGAAYFQHCIKCLQVAVDVTENSIFHKNSLLRSYNVPETAIK